MYKMTTVKIVIIISAIIILIIICIPFAAGMLFDYGILDPCETTIYQTLRSNDGAAQAVVFERECGATVGFNKQVSVCPFGIQFSSDRCPPFLVTMGMDLPVVRWIGADALDILVPPGAKVVLRSETAGHGIAVHYR